MEWLFRIKAILLAPRAEWPVIAQEKGDAQALFIPYVAVLAVVPAFAHFIGAALVGGYAPILSSLAGAVGIYLSGFAVVYVIALITDALAPTFGAQKNFIGALKLAAYSYTPVWLSGIFLIVPGLSFLVIFGLYGVHLLRAGLPVLMRTPEEKASRYAAVIAGCALAIAVALGGLEAPLFGPD
jgi:Yip1 domain